MKIAIAGGGTGGHLFPALAVGEVLQARGHEVLIFISEKEIDALAIQGRTEFRFETLPGVGLPRLFSPAMLRFFKSFHAAFSRCRAVFADFKPDVVLGMGGFISTAPILAVRLRRVPTAVHESNAIPGKANRLNARLCNRVLLGFEECRRHFPRSQCVVTGTPIRRALQQRIPKDEALAFFDLNPALKTLLIIGGSQGAHGMNEAVCRAALRLKDAPLQLLHLSGAADEAALREAYRVGEIPAHVAAFCHRMEAAYCAADLVIARSGAASLSEIASFSLPSILIPYPNAAENHQHLNAELFARAGAAALLKESDATGDTLSAMIRNLTRNDAELAAMGAAAARLAPGDAAERVAETLLSF